MSSNILAKRALKKPNRKISKNNYQRKKWVYKESRDSENIILWPKSPTSTSIPLQWRSFLGDLFCSDSGPPARGTALVLLGGFELLCCVNFAI